jgi:hypothetical protein
MREALVEVVLTALVVGLVVGAGVVGYRRRAAGSRPTEADLLRPVRGVLTGDLLRPVSRALAGDMLRAVSAAVWVGAAVLALSFVALVYLAVSSLVDF